MTCEWLKKFVNAFNKVVSTLINDYKYKFSVYVINISQPKVYTTEYHFLNYTSHLG